MKHKCKFDHKKTGYRNVVGDSPREDQHMLEALGTLGEELLHTRMNRYTKIGNDGKRIKLTKKESHRLEGFKEGAMAVLRMLMSDEDARSKLTSAKVVETLMDNAYSESALQDFVLTKIEARTGVLDYKVKKGEEWIMEDDACACVSCMEQRDKLVSTSEDEEADLVAVMERDGVKISDEIREEVKKFEADLLAKFPGSESKIVKIEGEEAKELMKIIAKKAKQSKK